MAQEHDSKIGAGTRSNAAWLVAGRIASDALAFALFVIVARQFGPSGIGVYSFNFAIATILYEVITLGIEEYGVREFARRPDEERATLIGGLLGAQLAITSMALLVVAALVAGNVFDEADVTLLSFMILYQIGCAGARTLFIPAFVAGKVSIQATAEVLSRVGTLVLAVALVAAGEPSLASTLTGLPVFGLTLMLVAGYFAHRSGVSVVPRLSWQDTTRTLTALWSFAAANLLTGLFSRTPIVVLFLLAGSEKAGIFASAYKFAEVGWLVLTLVPWAAYAHLSRLFHTERGYFRSLSSEVLRTTLVFGGLIAWGMFWVVPPLMGPLLGERFVAAIPVLQALSGFILVLGASAFLTRLLLVAEMQLARFWIMAVQAALNLALNLVLVPLIAIEGAVIAFIASQCVATLLQLRALRAHAGLTDIVRSIGIFILCVAAAVSLGAATSHYSHNDWAAAVVSLGVLLAAARVGGLLNFAQRAVAMRS